MESKRKRNKSKHDSGWSEIKGGQAFVIPVALLKHDNFRRLSPHACKLLFDLGRQFTGSNNGYLHPGIKVLREQGWHSSHTIVKAIRELRHYRILTQTVQGGKNRPSYYGFTFRKITENPKRPFDRPMPIKQPTDEWETPAEAFPSGKNP